jgi:predicted MFS family arabinose efflux permease
MALAFIKESVSEEKTKFFDWWGAVTLGIALTSLVLVLDKGIDWGWFATKSLLCYLSMFAFTAIFIKIEHKAKEPIVDLKFFKNSLFVNTLMNNFVVFMGMMGGVFLLPIFAQTYMGLDATKTGYLFIPMAFTMMLAAPIGGALTGRVKPSYVIAASTAVAGLGLYMFSFMLDPKSTAIDVIIPLTVLAFGMGFGMAQRTNIVASVVPEHEIGIASSILALARNIAGAFGIAVFSTILTDTTKSNVLKIGIQSHIYSRDPNIYKEFIALIILKAQVDAYKTVFIVSAAVLAVGAISALWIRVKNEKTDVKVMVE